MLGKISKRTVDAMTPGEVENFLWDTDLKGFGLKMTPAGKRVYILQYRHNGRLRRYTIGPHGPLTPDKAREEATRLLGMVATGQDPMTQKAAAKAVPTLAEAAERFLAEHANPQTKPRTAHEYRRLFDKIIIPHLGKLRIDAIQRNQLGALHHDLRETPYQANRVLGLLSKLFAWCELVGLRSDRTNPTLHIQKYKEIKRECLLSDDDLARLGQAILEVEQVEGVSPYTIAALRLLILTGARLREILNLKWSEVNFQHGSLRLSDSKTGAKSITLNPPALEMLASMPRLEGNPFVLPGRIEGHALVNVGVTWRMVKTKAGLEALRIHDLRHTFASVGACMGLSLPIIGKLLGHSQASTTQRYAHLANDPLKRATAMIGAHIANALEGKKESENVVPLIKNVNA